MYAQSLPPVGTIPDSCRSLCAERAARIWQSGNGHLYTSPGTLFNLRKRYHSHEQGQCDGHHRAGTCERTLHGRFPLARPETLAQRVRTQAAGTVVGKRQQPEGGKRRCNVRMAHPATRTGCSRFDSGT